MQKRQLSTFDVIGIVVGLWVIGLITQNIINGGGQSSQKVNIALSDMEKISNNVLREPATVEPGSRGIASVENPNAFEGVAGNDPWGHPYQYRVLRNAYGLPTHVMVWSKGANGSQDTADSELNHQNQMGQVQLQGDDVGYLRALR